MANYKQLIPFIFHFSSGVYGKNGSDLRLPLEEQFELAKKRGWSDDPDDPGGATMVDVTISTYSTFRKRKGLSLPTKPLAPIIAIFIELDAFNYLKLKSSYQISS